MDADSWSAGLSSATKRYQSALQSQSDMLMGFEEIDADDDMREEFPCPYCSEYFDVIGLCCHIDDEHPLDAKTGVCPICAMRVRIDMVAHITINHGSIFKVQRKRKTRKVGSNSTLSMLRRELLAEGTLQSLFGGSSSCIVSSTSAAPDPLLSSFILPMTDDFSSPQPKTVSSSSNSKKSLEEKVLERNVPMSVKDQEERTMRGEFIRGLLMSTVLHDDVGL